MKVILLKDVAKIGQKYEVKNVASGFALNFLIPRGLAENATEKAVKNIESRRADEEARRATSKKETIESLEKLKKEGITIESRANEKGHLFAGIDTAQIAKKIAEISGAEINPAWIILPEHIKEIGERELEIKVGEKKLKLSLKVESTK